ncbi:hypothetical protein [Gracilibacillus thailandensis]|uniref:Uncharacterized protein n=1 Tax=Gracilibacillus thailandensis TaxID=563735 RepID=A0A6N7QYC0_9BACI|nr:hypothetical protein [Gracilibacillus thailandensis]MRI65875.1 hypothetical protein [Gracilibacillus thailandensis]
MKATKVKSGFLRFDEGMLRRAMFSDLLDAMEELRIKKTKDMSPTDEEFTKNTSYAISEYYKLDEFYEKIKRELALLVKEFPELETFQTLLLHEMSKLLERQQDSKILLNNVFQIFSLLNLHLEACAKHQQNLSKLYVQEDSFYIRITLEDKHSDHLEPQELTNSQYLNIISKLITEIRRENRLPSFDERFAIRLAYVLLEKGHRFDGAIIPWGNSGFRDVQTYASITDPGIGHLYGTVKSNKDLKGVIVHIEHLERGSDQDRELVEPYRIPNFHIIGKVKLHVGSDAPSSSYVGRPVFESDFKPSVVKTIHTLAAACSAIFMDGLTECKLAIERMSTTEAIQFMKYMAGNVRRDPHSQALAAAFNINTPILDDREQTLKENNGEPRLVTDRFEIGMLGIEIVKEGGFDKVTWDGTANTYPSKCVIEQLSFSESLTLVHKAHEEGLITYFSAGFRFKHLPQVIYTGTDGIGLGGAQILRYMDKNTGFHGPFKEENISKIIEIREEATNDIKGKAAILLSRLDRMYFEKSIKLEDNEKRELLFAQLRDLEEDKLVTTMQGLRHIESLPIDSNHPLFSWALRLVSAGTTSIAAQTFNNERQWQAFCVSLQNAMNNHDYDELAELLFSIQKTTQSLDMELVTV